MQSFIELKNEYNKLSIIYEIIARKCIACINDFICRYDHEHDYIQDKYSINLKKIR